MGPKIILIETSTDTCSAALCDGESILASRCGNAPKIHASMLVPYIQDVLAQAGIPMKEIDAVAVSEGPGSYTGLRVGVSTAKGLCFGAGKPLIGVDTLSILAQQGKSHDCKPDFIVPFIDARRMEVYAASFDSSCAKLSETEAAILDENSFGDLLAKGRVLFIGTGVEKFKEVCQSENAFFLECPPLAEGMASEACRAYNEKEFEDTAYFEPFYLKEFVAGISKKSLL